MVLPDADATFEPETPHVGRTDGETWFGHPRQLARLFSVEAWERFGFYGMRALLVLYLTNHFLFEDRQANGLYGGYTALVYLTPLIGGWLADRYLGSKRSVKFGAVVMAVGYFTLCFGGQPAKPYATVEGVRYEVKVDAKRQQYVVDGARQLAIKGHEDGSVTLVAPDGAVARTIAKGGFVPGAERSSFYTLLMLFALSAITIGNGFFKPNISTIVGALYAQGDRRRDAGFTIFYMGINLGSLFSQALCPWLADTVGWWAGFLLAAVGMLLAGGLMQFDGGKLDGYGEPPADASRKAAPVIYILSILAVPVAWFLFVNLMNQPEPAAGSGLLGYVLALPLAGKMLFFTFLAAVIGIPIWSWKAGTRVEAQMMMAAILLVVFNVFFWTLFEQAGSSLTLFADRNTNLSVGWFSMSAGQTQVFNPVFIVILAPLMSILWNAMAKRGWEPSIPVKFGIALIMVAVGFFVLVVAGQFVSGPDYRVPLWTIALLYFFHSAAELCISPVGLSMITKLAMARIVGMMMGVWFLSISVAQYFAGMVAQVASVETVGGQVTNAKVSLETYLHVFQTIGIVAVIAGLVLLGPGAWLLKRWMHGVR